MGSIADVIADAKTGLRLRLSTTPGLTPPDGVRVSSALLGRVDEFEPGTELVELGDVTIVPGERPDLRGTAGSPSLRGFLTVVRPGSGEDAVTAARDRAAALMALVEQAIRTDPTVDGTIAPPGGTSVSIEGLSESPGDHSGQATRRASIPFTVTWTSHV